MSFSELVLFVEPQEEDMEIEGVQFNVLRAFHHELRVDALAWSPESRLDRIPMIRYWSLFPAACHQVIFFVLMYNDVPDILVRDIVLIFLCLDFNASGSILLQTKL